jgi:hypothetical protein
VFVSISGSKKDSITTAMSGVSASAVTELIINIVCECEDNRHPIAKTWKFSTDLVSSP